MLFYFILFIVIGFGISLVVKEQEKSFIVFIIIAILWSFVFNIGWGLVSLAEMALGYLLSKIFR